MYQRQPVEEVLEEGESLQEGFAKELAEYLYFSDRAYDEPNDVKLQEKMEKRGKLLLLALTSPLRPVLYALPHFEIVKYYQSTGKAHAKVLHNFKEFHS